MQNAKNRPALRGRGCLLALGLAAFALAAGLGGAAAAQETRAMNDREWPARMDVQATGETVEVDTGALRFGLALGERATLRYVEHDGKRIVSDNHAPLLAAQIMESRAYDGVTDYAPDAAFVDGDYRVTEVEHERTDRLFIARLTGRISFGDDGLPFTLTLSAEAGEPRLNTVVEMQAEGEFQNRYIRQVRLSLPLDLHWRKRIAQGGDRGMSWDTRYYYEFLRGLPQDPGRNEWRHFAVEQAGPDHFRIWRAESEATPPLFHQHGVRAPGWTSVYDRDGGMLLAYRDMPARAPKTLWIEAAGGGEARMLLYPHTERAFHARNAQLAARVFGEPHEMDWVFYTGEHRDARPEDWLANLWGKGQPFAGQRPRSFRELNQPELWDAPASEEGLSPYVRGGLPFERGELTAQDGVRLFGPNGELPVQHRPIAHWPDGSVKWLLVVFPLEAEAGTTAPPSADSAEFTVSLRNGEPVPLTLYHGSALRPMRPRQPVQAREAANAVMVSTGPLRVLLTTGEQWLARVELNGQPMLRSPGGSFLDFLRAEEAYPVASTHPSGRLDPGALRIDRIDLEESGPLRAVVRLEGESLGEEPARIILRLKFHAGRSWVRLFHTVEFRHADPREAFVRRMGFSLPLRLNAADARVTAGGQDGPVEAEAREYNALHQLAPGHYRMVAANAAGPETLDENRRSRGWMDVSDGQGGVTVVMRNMWQDAPKEIAYRPDDGMLTALLWPEGGPLMDVRRYSEYPHWAQGESAGRNNDWVTETFFPGGPMVGIARTHEMAIHFHDGSPGAGAKDSVAADFQSPPLIYAGYDRYREADVFFALPDYERLPLMSENFTNFTDFWLFHQELHNWYGFWDYGDIQHRYRSGGRGNFVDPEHLKEQLRRPPNQQRLDGQHTTLDYLPQQDWHFDNGRWGWTNTEGLPGVYLQSEYMRTGRRDVFFANEALARHCQDVVTRHHGPRFGKGTRHGVQHWSDGNHEERQTIVSEVRLHHYLSGEMRSRDVMARLAEEYYSMGRVNREREHNARLYGLFAYWEMTGDREAGQMMRDYIRGMIVPEGIAASAEINFSRWAAEVGDQRRDINYPGMFFHNFGAMHALLEYYAATKDTALRDALVKMGDAILRGGVRMNNHAAVIGFAAAHGHEGAQEYLRDWIRGSGGFGFGFNTVSAQPARWSGALARMYSNQPTVMFAITAMPMVMVALQEEPELAERYQQSLEDDRALSEDDIRRLDEGDQRGFRAKRRLEWQHEYDDPELLEYFGPWRPPETKQGN